jgi:hypothetical protein
MEVRFLYCEDCPSHVEAIQRLRKVMAEEGVEGAIDVVKVETQEDAEKLRFPGSPTILINGLDIDPSANPYYAVTCRAYRLEDGRISALPSEAMIRKALRNAYEKEAPKEKEPRGRSVN